jgi:hypothetical protein
MYHPGCTKRQNRKRDPIAPELQNLQKLFQN